VVARKKNGEIHIYINFIDINRASIKYNYALPNMDMLLQHVIGSALMSMLDGFFGYI